MSGFWEDSSSRGIWACWAASRPLQVLGSPWCSLTTGRPRAPRRLGTLLVFLCASCVQRGLGLLVAGAGPG